MGERSGKRGFRSKAFTFQHPALFLISLWEVGLFRANVEEPAMAVVPKAVYFVWL
jgi:hypothetical protein